MRHSNSSSCGGRPSDGNSSNCGGMVTLMLTVREDIFTHSFS